MERVYQHTVDRGIKLLNLTREAAEAALSGGRHLHGQVHCAVWEPVRSLLLVE